MNLILGVLGWVQEMSGEVVDSNPYSRLMALKRMGIVNNYEEIRKFSVAIVVSPSSENRTLFAGR